MIDRDQALFEVADDGTSIRPARHDYRRRGTVDEFLHSANIVVAPGAETMVRWKVRRKDGNVVIPQEFGDPVPVTRIRPATVNEDRCSLSHAPSLFGARRIQQYRMSIRDWSATAPGCRRASPGRRTRRPGG